jgi:hypothetical protein
MSQITQGQTPDVLHLRFNGRSDELSLQALGLSPQSDDDQIKQALATYLERPLRELDRYVVARHRAAIVVRPEAIYG